MKKYNKGNGIHTKETKLKIISLNTISASLRNRKSDLTIAKHFLLLEIITAHTTLRRINAIRLNS